MSPISTVRVLVDLWVVLLIFNKKGTTSTVPQPSALIRWLNILEPSFSPSFLTKQLLITLSSEPFRRGIAIGTHLIEQAFAMKCD